MFRTVDLPFSAFLVSTRSLEFLRCEPEENGRVSFVFEDPQNKGEGLWLEYQAGAQVPAAAFYSCVKYLRQVMDAVTGKRRERRSYGHEYHSNGSDRANGQGD